MGYFTSPLRLTRPINAKDYFIVYKDFTFVSEKFNKRITVKKGFQTDGTSSPKWLWFFAPPFTTDAESAIIHDALYACRTLPKHIADRIYLECMEARELSHTKSKIKFYGVDLFGYSSYNDETKSDDNNKGLVKITEVNNDS